jgi:hypothetical protein
VKNFTAKRVGVFAAGARSQSGIKNLVAEAIPQEEVRFASPVFVGENDGELIFTESILMRFGPEVSEEWRK